MSEAPACRECADDLGHCHGVVVMHADGLFECVDDGRCEMLLDGHALVLACDDPTCCLEIELAVLVS